MDKFVFVLDSHFLKTAVNEVKGIAEMTIAELMIKNEVCPDKFTLCWSATRKMQDGDPVSKDEIQGMLDTIGGFFSATVLYCDKYGGEQDQLLHAKELMRFADLILEQVRPIWGLTLVK